MYRVTDRINTRQHFLRQKLYEPHTIFHLFKSTLTSKAQKSYDQCSISYLFKSSNLPSSLSSSQNQSERRSTDSNTSISQRVSINNIRKHTNLCFNQVQNGQLFTLVSNHVLQNAFSQLKGPRIFFHTPHNNNAPLQP